MDQINEIQLPLFEPVYLNENEFIWMALKPP